MERNHLRDDRRHTAAPVLVARMVNPATVWFNTAGLMVARSRQRPYSERSLSRVPSSKCGQP
jgi:hypothetical protein